MNSSKNIAFFCIPAHGHTNPMLPVAKELVKRGNTVRFYSFDEFEEKIKNTGAEFVSCSKYLPEIDEKQEEKLKNISLTEMSIQDIKITLSMNDFLQGEFESFKPDVVYTDSVCFWGKLNAKKFNVPIVVSTSTFAFNQLSNSYIKNTPAEMADMIFGLPKIGKELKTLEPYGYTIKNPLELVRNDNDTDTVVYTSSRFQPYSESYSKHYNFVGPSVFSDKVPDKKNKRPLLYISLGTVINEKPNFYKSCIEAFKDSEIDVIISCGRYINIEVLGNLPDNIKVYPYVDQLDVLSRANAFISHCGMNSASESIYMATPIILFPQTGEQYAVARRVKEIGAGTFLKGETPEIIRKTVEDVLNNKDYAKAAEEGSRDFRSCSGAKGAADFIENAPHDGGGRDLIQELNKKNGEFMKIYWIGIIVTAMLIGALIGWSYLKYIFITAGVLSYPISLVYQKAAYKKLANSIKEQK